MVGGGDPLGNADSILITLNDPTGGPVSNVDFELDSISVRESKVPEPSTLALLCALGLSAAVAVSRRNKK